MPKALIAPENQVAADRNPQRYVNHPLHCKPDHTRAYFNPYARLEFVLCLILTFEHSPSNPCQLSTPKTFAVSGRSWLRSKAAQPVRSATNCSRTSAT